MTPKDAIRRTDEILVDESVWLQDHAFENDEGKVVAFHYQATKFCLMGALEHACGGYDGNSALFEESAKLLQAEAVRQGHHYITPAVMNDRTDFPTVKAVLRGVLTSE